MTVRRALRPSCRWATPTARRPSILHAGAGAGGAALLALGCWAVARRGTCRATPAESDETLPGDELVPGPADCTTRAIDIDADPDRVWAWLVQVGTDRGGWYSHDRLERLAGVPVHSTGVLRDEWQHLAVGDRVCLAPPGWMGLEEGMALPVVDVVAGRHLVLRQCPPDSPWDGVWSFHLRPSGGGTRFVIRSRTARTSGPGRIVAVLTAPVGRLVTGVMERGMLRGIRRRAESGPVALEPPPRPVLSVG